MMSDQQSTVEPCCICGGELGVFRWTDQRGTMHQGCRDKGSATAPPRNWKGRATLDEIERLRAGFLRCVQSDNKCTITGAPCREPERCGCHLEMEGWLDAG